MSMQTKAILLALLLIPFCASSAWREGFSGDDTLLLVGEGHAKSDLPQIQATAMAGEAAIINALSHWPKYCGDADATQFRIENQKRRTLRCDGHSCQVKIVIEKNNLRATCNG